MKILYLFLLLSLVSLLSIAQSTNWKVTASSIMFKIKNAGVTVNGNLSGLIAAVTFDTGKSFGNKIEASIEANTINTGINSRDAHLKKEEYFSVDKFPKINMKATTFSKEPDGKFKGFFTITIKGISNTLPVIFSFTETETTARIMGEFKINRLDYKVGDTSWMMSNDVIVKLDVSIGK